MSNAGVKHYFLQGNAVTSPSPGNRRGWTTNQLRTQCAVDGGVVYIGYTQMEKGRYHPILSFKGYILCCREYTDGPQRARRLGRDIAIEIFGEENNYV